MGGGGGGIYPSNISIFRLFFLLRTTGVHMSLEAEEIETHSSSSSIFPEIFRKQSHDKMDVMKEK